MKNGLFLVAMVAFSANAWAEDLPEGMTEDPAYDDFVVVPNPGGDPATQECRISRRSMSLDPVVYGSRRAVPRVLSTGSGRCARRACNYLVDCKRGGPGNPIITESVSCVANADGSCPRMAECMVPTVPPSSRSEGSAESTDPAAGSGTRISGYPEGSSCRYMTAAEFGTRVYPALLEFPAEGACGRVGICMYDLECTQDMGRAAGGGRRVGRGEAYVTCRATATGRGASRTFRCPAVDACNRDPGAGSSRATAVRPRPAAAPGSGGIDATKGR